MKEQLEWQEKYMHFLVAKLEKVAFVIRPSLHQPGCYICHAEESYKRGIRLLAIFPSIEECKELCQKLANGEECVDQDGDQVLPIYQRFTFK